MRYLSRYTGFAILEQYGWTREDEDEADDEGWGLEALFTLDYARVVNVVRSPRTAFIPVSNTQNQWIEWLWQREAIGCKLAQKALAILTRNKMEQGL